jgi:D-sedoheptulose 7-phosphate isomerase
MNTEILHQMTGRYPSLEIVREKVFKSSQIIIECFSNGGKLLVCGNGGSSADSDHIVGELMKSFEIKRPVNDELKEQLLKISDEKSSYLSEKLEQGLPAISLNSHTALISAVSNDTDPRLVFAQQVVGYGNKGDVLLGISTSGNSQNVINALITAKAKGLITIGLTGYNGGIMKQYCDLVINVPAKSTTHIQELHLPVYHTICQLVENHFFGKK